MFKIRFGEMIVNVKSLIWKAWKEKSAVEKTLTIVGGILSAVLVALAILQITGTYNKAIMIIEPLLGILMLIQAWNMRKSNKFISAFSLCVAVFIFIVAVVIFIK